MSREQPAERTVRRLFEDVINGQRYERLPRYCSRDVVMHRPGGVVLEGLDAYEEHYRRLRKYKEKASRFSAGINPA